jgi:hypothetical protein
MDIALFNDTAVVPHVGCQAVSDGHVRMLAAAGHRVTHRSFVGDEDQYWGGRRDRAGAVQAILRRSLRGVLERADAIVVNGEGTIHHQAGRALLAVIEAAQSLGRPTFLVNAVIEGLDGYDEVLGGLHDLTVRDGHSARFLAARGIRHRLVPDSCLAAAFDSVPLFDLTGRTVVTDWHWAREADVGRTVQAVLRRADLRPFFLPLLHDGHRTHWRRIPATLRQADLLVTARHHGIYMAALAGIPFVALPSNTHKIEGLLEAAGMDIPVCASLQDVERAIVLAREEPERFSRFNAWLLAHRPLTTFAGLDEVSDAAAPRPLGVEVELARLEEDREVHQRTRRPGRLAAQTHPAGATAVT